MENICSKGSIIWDVTREEHDIPGIEGLLEMMQAEEMQKRERSDTVHSRW